MRNWDFRAQRSRRRPRRGRPQRVGQQRVRRPVLITEPLEARQLLSADPLATWGSVAEPTATTSSSQLLSSSPLWSALSRGHKLAVAPTPSAGQAPAADPPATGGDVGSGDVLSELPPAVGDSSASPITNGSSAPPTGSLDGPPGNPLAAEGEGEPAVRFRTEIRDTSGTPISEVVVGDEVVVAVLVQDIRATGGPDRGVFSAYVDLTYEAARAEPTSQLTFGTTYANSQTGTVTDGLLDEVGALAGLTATGTDEFLLFTVRLRATQEGTLSIGLNMPDMLPLHEITLYDTPDALEEDQIEFVGDDVMVLAEMSPADDTVQYSGTGDFVAVDVLANDTVRKGPATITELSTPSNGGEVRIVSGGGSVEYKPASGFSGTETFTYTIENPQGTSSQATVTVTVEGQQVEGDPDLVAFAKALAAANVRLFGAGWNADTTAQKQLFEDGQIYLTFIEATNPDKSFNQAAIDNEITTLPTWIFDDGSRLTGVQTLAAIADHAGIDIPEGVDPSLAPIDDVTVLQTSPLHIPLDGYDPNGGPLTYTISVENPELLTASVLSGSRSLRFRIAGFGDMVFELFEQEASRATSRIIELAQAGFYDDVTFHRVIESFVIQAGDPTGTGQGGSDLGDFDDQFDVDLQHNRGGVLSMAKGTDDTNDSQFFITAPPLTTEQMAVLRNLDFHHTVFGQLIEGEDVRHNIARVPVTDDRPDEDVVIESVLVFDDIENGLARLTAAPGATGTTTVTVTATDAEGNSVQRTFEVTVGADTHNGTPFLVDVTTQPVDFPGPITFQVDAIDPEGDAVTIEATKLDPEDNDFEVQYNATTKTVTVAPMGFRGGIFDVLLYAYPSSMSPQEVEFQKNVVDGGGEAEIDRQVVRVTLTPTAPTRPFLDQSTDSGLGKTDGVTNITDIKMEVGSLFPGAKVELMLNGEVIAERTVADTGQVIQPPASEDFEIDMASRPDGTYNFTARQYLDDVPSVLSEPLTVQIDRTAPVPIETLPTQARVGQDLNFNLQHPEEGKLIHLYGLVGAPSGMSINQSTGVISWTPITTQLGNHTFGITFTDAAGNVTSQTAHVAVVSGTPQVRISLKITDLEGNEIDSIAAGSDFLVSAYVQDITATPTGIRAAFVDVNYDSQFAMPSGQLTPSNLFPDTPAGTINQAGLINEAGSSTTGTVPDPSGNHLLWTLRLTALMAGTVNFSPSPADDSPDHDVRRESVSTAVPVGLVEFVGDQLAILSGVVARPDTATVNEDSTDNVIDVLANDELVGVGGALTLAQVGSTNRGGTVTIVDGKIHYTPAPDFSGTETFTYTASNGDTETGVGTVTVTVTGSNDPPVANDDTVPIPEDTPFNINVLLNDTNSDPEDTLTVIEVSDPEHGTATIRENGSIRYQPDADYNGPDSFTYTISDGNDGTDTATVTIEVLPFNDPPVATEDTATTPEDTALTIDVADLLENDTTGAANESGQVLTITAVTAGTGGTVVLNQDNTIVFTPAADFHGTATFTYTLSDDGVIEGLNDDPLTATGTVTVTVTSVNDNPTAANDTFNVSRASLPFVADLLANDSFAPDTGETLTITQVSTGSHGGTLTIANDKLTVSYQPAEGFLGVETFTYTISDGNGGTAQATVSLNVQSFSVTGLTGKIYIDGNSNGQHDSNELPLAGVTIELTGTDSTGAPVSRSAVSNASGVYSFPDINSGNYTLTQVQPAFLIDGNNNGASGNSSTVSISDSGTVTGNLDFNEQGLQPHYSIWGALASTTKDGILVALNDQGLTSWLNVFGGWSRFSSVSASLSVDGQQLVIVGTEPDGDRFQTTVALTDTSKLVVMGRDADGSLLLRVRAASDQFTFTPVSNGGTASAMATDAAFATL